MDILQSVMDSASHAMFTMDRQGIVTHINQQAKERFGLYNHSVYSHPAGRLEPGDVVILATSAMGADDGNLAPEDLAAIGIQDHRLRSGDMLAAVGVYHEAGVKPVYKYLRDGEAVELRLEVSFQGVSIDVRITGEEIAVIKTSKGDIRVQLAGKDAPIHVGNFVELATKGFYDNLKFHRYVPGFVIQGGCPNTRDLDTDQVIAAAGNPFAGLGTGGPGYCIKEEYSTNPNNHHADGALAMARSQNPDSAGSQFYLCLGAQPMLDSGYTVFGQTIEGMDVIAQLRVGDVIEGIEIENAAE